LDTPTQREDAFSAINRHVNFYLPFQMKDDCALQKRYASLVRRILAARYPELMIPLERRPAPDARRIRIGYISAHFRMHSVSKSHAGWILSQNRERFEVFVYQIKGAAERVRDDIRQGSEHFRHLSEDLPGLFSVIRRDRLDVAIFLDVGMHPAMTQLASLRLAPVQCVTWGTPMTTGSSTMDFFLSSALMEPADAGRYYSERLIALPGIGVVYNKPLIPRPLLQGGRVRFGIPQDSTVYLCAHNISTYLPAHDDIFVAIALRVPSARFVFITPNPSVGYAFQGRLDRAFTTAGLVGNDYCIFLPMMKTLEFWALNLASDVYLDSLDWSAFNTAMEAIACRLPIVTLPGGYMRGRHSYAILTQLGISETIARDKEDYVDIAVRLGTDAEWRKQVLQKMADGESQLFSDTSSIVALEEFLIGVVAKPQLN
jgi:protein O-GlcNAc transferase